MSWLLNIISIVIILVSVIFTLYYIFFKSNVREYPPGLPIIQNYLSPITGGYFDLLLIDVKKGNSGRLIVHAIPKDISEGDKDDIIKIPIPKENYREIPLGLLSSRRSHIVLLPKYSHELTNNFEVNSYLNKLINNSIEERALIESNIESNKNIIQNVKKFALGEMSKLQIEHVLEQIELAYKEKNKINLEEKDVREK